MVINRNAWHYRVYEFTYAFGNSSPPRTNLCQYVRRILLVGPLVFCLLLMLTVFAVIVTILALLFLPWFGYLPKDWKKPWDIVGKDGQYKYPGLKMGPSYNYIELYPWHAVLLGLLVLLEWVIYQAFGIHQLVVQGEWVGTILLLMAVVIGFFIYSDSSTGKVISAYLAAKKQKVCPLVEFQDKE